MSLTEEQWKLVIDKYEKLMWHVSHRVGGDRILHDIDDSYQELCITCLEAISTFSKNSGKEFDKFFDTLEFHKYLKTCLWNKKNAQGAKIVKRAPLRNGQVSLDEVLLDERNHVSRDKGQSFKLDTEERFDENSREIYESLVDDSRMVKPSGSINLNRLSKHVKKPKTQIKHTLERMKQQLSHYEEESK
jgi:hypothetical protein